MVLEIGDDPSTGFLQRLLGGWRDLADLHETNLAVHFDGLCQSGASQQGMGIVEDGIQSHFHAAFLDRDAQGIFGDHFTAHGLYVAI